MACPCSRDTNKDSHRHMRRNPCDSRNRYSEDENETTEFTVLDADGIPTTREEIIESFESNFADKEELPVTLVYKWFDKAVARYCIELEDVHYDKDMKEFESALSQYAIDTIANFMWQLYQERQVSKINKRISIVGKDLSYDGTGNAKKYSKEELDYITNKSQEMIDNQKPPAYR